jgi:hypothetical protein
MAVPIPMICVCVLSGFSALFSYFLYEQTTTFEKSEEKSTDSTNDNEEDKLLKKEDIRKED